MSKLIIKRPRGKKITRLEGVNWLRIGEKEIWNKSELWYLLRRDNECVCKPLKVIPIFFFLFFSQLPQVHKLFLAAKQLIDNMKHSLSAACGATPWCGVLVQNFFTCDMNNSLSVYGSVLQSHLCNVVVPGENEADMQINSLENLFVSLFRFVDPKEQHLSQV